MDRRVTVLFMVVVVALVTSPLPVAARANRQAITSAASTASGAASVSTSAAAPSEISPTAVAAPAPRDSAALVAAMQQLAAGSGATVGVTVVELGGLDPLTWSLDESSVFTAASTYKLAALMMEALNIASGTTDPNGLVCYQESDYEAGWFDDYAPGVCFTRNELAARAAKQSDNTAGHMLVRDLGGAAVLNAWTASMGTKNSAFFVGNTTTAADLAALWVAEANGDLGGAAAQAWLYPLLTGTTTESGIPAGVPAGSMVIHKTGTVDAVENDAALVESGPDGPYVLIVMTDGLGDAAGWALIASASAAVWQAEASRVQ
ncbi:MAG TPA: serine hydrolase [Candidatus Dormibacteraeota bacterium]|nr:serine hydrolase [Candidatus Dormibacteraeota bacterium]